MNWDLRVVPDVAAAGADLFWETAPSTVVLSGGTTPEPVYARLAAEAARHPWADTDVFFGDERCVPPSHPDSNYAMADRLLLSRVAPRRVFRMRGETCDDAGYEAALREAFPDGLPHFDLTFLGMGADGHTASLFPGSPALDERERWVVRTPGPDHPRLTLTVPALSASRLVVFLITGASKRARLQRILAGEDAPAVRIRAARVVALVNVAAAP